MKKVLKILFRIFYITLFSAILLVVIYGFFPKVWGTATIQIEGEPYVPETVTGNYELGEELKLNCRPDDEGINFSHIKGNYGMYDYVILIHSENIDTELTVHFFKTNQWKIKELDIAVEVYEEKGTWNADVVVETDGHTYEETFYNIEENTMEIRVE